MSASIIIKNLRIPAKIGFYQQEKIAPQTLKVDLNLGLGKSQSSLSDRLRDTVDYDSVIARTKQFALANHHDLLEHFTYELAQTLIAEFPLQRCEITAWKTIAAHQPAEIAVSVTIDAGHAWRDAVNDRASRLDFDDRYND